MSSAPSLEIPQLIEIRRHLHQHPEVSGTEYETTRFLANELEKLGIPFRLGPDQRGLLAELGSPNAARRLALRADIDAIPVQDTKQTPYHSKNSDCMHACGHDAHSTMLLGGLARIQNWLLANPDSNLFVRAIFQPEEEIAKGAQSMIEAGALESMQAIFGMHVDPTRPVGSVGLQTGVQTAHCNEIQIRVTGRSGHGARPHQTIDPIAAGAQFVQLAYASIPRSVDSREPVVFSICEFSGGHSANVIPDEVTMQGTLRTLTHASREKAIEQLTNLANTLSSATRAQFDLKFGTEVPAVVCDQSVTELVRAAASQVVGENQIQPIGPPSMGGEDFAFYSQEIPAAFLRLGCAGQEIGMLPLHNSGFDIDEKILPLGAELFDQVAREFATRE